MTTIRWNPDTCKCVFLVNEKFVMNEVENKCKMHNALKDNACFITVIDEQKKINLTPKLDGESDVDYQNRRWLLKEKALKGN